MLKKLLFLAVGSLAARAVKKYWNQRDLAQSKPAHKEAVQRWEDEGGMVPTPASSSPQRRRNASSAATNTAA